MDALQRYREVLAINRAIAGAQAYDEVLRLVVDRIAAFTGATACMLLLAQQDGLARVVRSIGIDPVKAAGLAVRLTEHIDRELSDVLGCESSDRFLGVPVIGKAGLLGIIALRWEGDGGQAGAHEEELLSALADQAAIALDNAEHADRLRASEEKLAGIISISADAIISIDEAQRVIMFNEGAQKMFGWSRSEILGKPLDLLMPARLGRRHRDHVAGFAAGPATSRMMMASLSGLRKNGEEFPMETAISRLRDRGAWIFTAVVRDVTEQKRVAHEELFLADAGTILSETLDYEGTLTSVAGLVLREFADFCVIELVDDLGQLRRVKAVGADPAKSAIYAGLESFPFDRGRPCLGRAVVLSKRPQMMAQISQAGLRKVAQSREHLRLLEALAPASAMGVPLIAHGRLLGVLVVASCRPERRYRASDLRLLAELGRRVALTLENVDLYRITQRAVQIRDDVLGVVAHDLRNPLATIALQAALLQRLEAELGPRARKLGDTIERAALRMKRLIQDLLDTARLESRSLPVELARMPAARLVLDSEESHRALAASGSIELAVEIAPELADIWGDRDRLLQVFENLLGNAMKFTPAGGRITLGARPAQDEIEFSVADTGRGISSADLPHLFERFWQARDGERRGAGLGLGIAKGIVEAHGGRIWVESTPAKGSTFHFTVPLASSLEGRAKGPPSSGYTNKPPGQHKVDDVVRRAMIH